MAKKNKRLFEDRDLTPDEIKDLFENAIKRFQAHEETLTSIINGCLSLQKLTETQQSEIAGLQAQITLRDCEIDYLTRRVISLEEDNLKKSCKKSTTNSSS